MILLHIEWNLISIVLAHSRWQQDSLKHIPSQNLDSDKSHWVPTHSVTLMFDQLHCRLIAAYPPGIDQTYHRCDKHSVLTLNQSGYVR